MFVSTAPVSQEPYLQRFNLKNNGMKRILFFVVAIMFATMTFAQYHGIPQRQRREFNPEEMAQRRTVALNDALQLDSMQLQAVFLMNYADALTMQDSIKARHKRMEEARARGEHPKRVKPSQEQMQAMAELQQQREQVRDEQMQQILTPEQYEKYLQFKEEQRTKMREMSGKRGGKGNRPSGASRSERMPR